MKKFNVYIEQALKGQKESMSFIEEALSKGELSILEISYLQKETESQMSRDNGNAYFLNGLMHAYGYVYPKDIAAAAELYKKASTLKCLVAILNLGNIAYAAKNYPDAFYYYQQASDLGDADATCKLASMYFYALNVPKNYNTAFKLYTLALKRGDNSAATFCNLGFIYFRKKKYQLAFTMYKQASDLGNANAASHLGLLFNNGLGVQKNLSEAFNYYVLAIEKRGYKKPNAFYNLANLYLEHKEYQKALELYKQASDKNHPEAACQLGRIYYDGIGVEKNVENAFNYYLLAIEKRQVKNPEAIYHLANLYNERKEFKKALDLYQQASDLGHPEAAAHCGRMYFYGIGVEKNLDEAFNYYTLAIEQRHVENPVELGRLATLYYERKEYKKAFDLYLQASNLSDKTASSNLGMMYYFGIGIEKNADNAFKYYSLAIEERGLKHAEAMCNLGNLYFDRQNHQKAFALYKQASDRNNAEAARQLARLFNFGLGVPSNSQEAFKYYTLAFERGDKHPESLRILGSLYRKGEVTDANTQKASELFKLASDGGDAIASAYLGQLFTEKENFLEAAKYFELAFERGYKTADDLYTLSNFYYSGNGVTQDFNKAFNLYKQASELGCNEATRELGRMYYYGLGTVIDYPSAFKHLISVIKHIDINDEILRILGNLYYAGQGGEQDYKKAFYYYEKASELGDAYAMTKLAHMYYYSLGTDKNYKEAARYARNAILTEKVVEAEQIILLLKDDKNILQEDKFILQYYRYTGQNDYSDVHNTFQFITLLAKDNFLADKTKFNILDILTKQNPLLIADDKDQHVIDLFGAYKTDKALHFAQTGDLISAITWLESVPYNSSYREAACYDIATHKQQLLIQEQETREPNPD